MVFGKDQPDLQVRDKDWGKAAKRKYQVCVGSEGVITELSVMKLDIPYYQKKITSDFDWYISNNLHMPTVSQWTLFMQKERKGVLHGFQQLQLNKNTI